MLSDLGSSLSWVDQLLVRTTRVWATRSCSGFAVSTHNRNRTQHDAGLNELQTERYE
jgi:hypothetical protein